MKVMHSINMDKLNARQAKLRNTFKNTRLKLMKTECNHRINQERYILPDEGYMLSETCRRNDDGPLAF
jgi:hypothetical protein